jgi:Tfp pilus assembly protein PilF
MIEQIVASLASRIEAAELRHALRKRSVNFNAYDAYLKGISYYPLEDRESFQSSMAMFEKATELDPNFARAWGARGYTGIRGVLLGWIDEAAMQQAEQHVYRAVELDPDDYANIWDLAFLHQNRRQFTLAAREYSRAVELNPNDADLLAEFAEFCTFAGEHERAIDLLGRAVRINPYYPDWDLWNLGRARYHAGQNERAIEELTQISRPSDHAELLSAAAHMRLGRVDEARHIIAKVRASSPACTISYLRWRDRFKNTIDEDYWLGALAVAGLPER